MNTSTTADRTHKKANSESDKKLYYTYNKTNCYIIKYYARIHSLFFYITITNTEDIHIKQDKYTKNQTHTVRFMTFSASSCDSKVTKP